LLVGGVVVGSHRFIAISLVRMEISLCVRWLTLSFQTLD
jgi:hypothetical protein